MSHLYGEEDLKQMSLKEDFDWSAPPPKKYKKVKVPSLVASLFSSSRDTDEYEDLAILHHHDILQGRSPHFQPFWSFDDKGGEI